MHELEPHPETAPIVVSPEEWQEAQEVRRQKQRTKDRDRAGAHVYLLTGLLYCGRCGNRMNGSGGKVGKYGWYGYYHCQARRDHRMCDLPSPRSEALETAILGTLPDALHQIPEVIMEQERSSEGARVRIEQLKVQLDDLADEKRYYRNEHRRNRLTDDELDVELRRIADEEKRLRVELDRVQSEAQLPDLLRLEADRRRQLADHVARWKERPEEIDRHQLRALIQAAVERIVYRGPNDLDLHLRFSHPTASTASTTGT